MQYSLLIYQTERQFADRTDPARRDANGAAFGNFVQMLHEGGVLLTTLGIEPPEQTAAIRASTGAPLNGPAASTKEQLGGVCVIEAPNLAAALAWAKRAPFEHCAVVEVRPTRLVSVS